MGGNAFEDLEKLTPFEYTKYSSQLTDLIGPLCERMEPYIPLPEKQVHGDIDFLIIFKQGNSLQDIIQLMKLTKDEYIINHNLTANTVYHKKQIDFNIILDNAEFERCKFYKSYSGIGAFLGLLLPSKLVKINENGIICCSVYKHIKLEFNACDSVPEILKYYGLSAERYFKGFETRKDIFQFLLGTRFLETVNFREKKPKWTTKLISSFQEFLKDNESIVNPTFETYEDPLAMTLKYFKKQKEFEEAWKLKLLEDSNKKDRALKWNGKHIMEIFGIPNRELNPLKKLFDSSFGSRKEYEAFIDSHSREDIILAFSKVCQMDPKNQEPELKK